MKTFVLCQRHPELGPEVFTFVRFGIRYDFRSRFARRRGLGRFAARICGQERGLVVCGFAQQWHSSEPHLPFAIRPDWRYRVKGLGSSSTPHGTKL